ncbi:shikimate 5-dehydrogenase [Legionella busanensis]|uniref:Shikimate dehydrogenase (NADP(+)) n=1 Tax=Legionella busanensis TaxID=190655 RepID=A0A378JN41_9GAMM|nr:shikimate dehydrogenase [Legionella busanensis]STX52786.1 shikimate 5-dehydrogenase [Legionella busanensis]
MISRCAVVGNPIAHSLSPIIHQNFAKQAGTEIIYDKILGNDTNFEEQVIDFFQSGGTGLNITLPFKERAFKMANQVTARCLKAKAANTLWMQGNQLWADNTDGVGLIKDLEHYIDIADKDILLLGAGGAARGIIGPLLEASVKRLTIVNRTKEKLVAVANDFPSITLAEFSELSGAFNVIINATSASLSDSPFTLLPVNMLANKPFCYDLAYNREKDTPFINFAKENSCKAYDGLGMLVEQAAEAFYIWHDFKPETTSVLGALKNNSY